MCIGVQLISLKLTKVATKLNYAVSAQLNFLPSLVTKLNENHFKIPIIWLIVHIKYLSIGIMLNIIGNQGKVLSKLTVE